MGTTPLGIPYPDSTSSVQIWTHIQATATAIDTLLAGPLTPMRRFVFTANGTYTQSTDKIPKTIIFRTQASGGSGGGAAAAASSQHTKGGGGGAGAYAERVMDASAVSATVAITVGAGVAGVSGAAGNNGNASSAGSYVGAGGGVGGGSSSSSLASFGVLGGLGGSSSSGTPDFVVPGSPGDSGYGDGILGMGGNGAGSRFGAGGRAGLTTSAGQSVGGSAGTGYGSGGGGAAASSTGAAATSGASPSGIVIVDELF